MARAHNNPRENNGKGISFLRAHLNYAGDDCVIWPMARDNHGYGILGFGGGVHKAHKLMCELAHGQRPTDGHQASHSCGNGHKGCVNPRHLSWETASENQRSRRKHGTARTNRWGRKGKLTADQIRAIVALRGRTNQQAIAEQFGISLPTVRRVFGGKTKMARAALTALTE